MIEKLKKIKKGIITEEDISTLFQRKTYAPSTVLALLQEVAQYEGGVKIDWNALVKNSTTGISSAREYQMLWRHLAYRQPLVDRLDDGALPLDDDSDLEYDLEAFPAVSSEASAEASACVKVLIASGLTSSSSHPNNAMVEAPLTINIPNGQLGKSTSESSELPAMRGMNITVPVSVQKQHLPAIPSTEPLVSNGSVNGTNRPKRKRSTWTDEDDLELVAAVKKYGERNWENILRSEFACKRTVKQLSQRWAKLREKVGNLNLATTSSSSGVRKSEEQKAAQIALNLALDPPARNTFMNSGEGTSSQHHSQRAFAAVKSQITVNKQVKPELGSDPVRATAVAAGARIVSQSDAASLLKAAQSKNTIHIMPTVKPTLPSHKEGHSNGLPTPPPVSSHPAVPSSGPRVALERAPSQSIQRNQVAGSATNVPAALTNAAKLQVQEHRTSNGRNEASVQVKQDIANLPNQESSNESLKVIGRNETSVLVKQEKANLPNQEAKIKNQVSSSESSEVAEGSRSGDKVNCLSVDKAENQRPVQGLVVNGKN